MTSLLYNSLIYNGLYRPFHLLIIDFSVTVCLLRNYSGITAMRLIKVTGGLGNQMFIYAMYLGMKELFPGVRLDISDMVHYEKHNGYELHRVFDLPNDEFSINQPLKKIIEFLFFKTILERKQGGSLEPYRCKYYWPFIYFKGFYQSEKYFADVRDRVRAAFSFDLSLLSVRTKKLLSSIGKDSTPVSIHVRRGDYTSGSTWDMLGCVCTSVYYDRCVSVIFSRVENPKFYVFSDDVDWVRCNLSLPEGCVFVDWNRENDSWQDMFLMSCCSHNVICNSTFSWWGAWLNGNRQKIVLCPDRWFANGECTTPDLIPSDWIKVKTA